MEFTDDLDLIKNDITEFRARKDKYWLNRMRNENNRMYSNAYLKNVHSDLSTNTSINPAGYVPSGDIQVRRERRLSLKKSKESK